jgi:hypothetical protein
VFASVHYGSFPCLDLVSSTGSGVMLRLVGWRLAIATCFTIGIQPIVAAWRFHRVVRWSPLTSCFPLGFILAVQTVKPLSFFANHRGLNAHDRQGYRRIDG